MLNLSSDFINSVVTEVKNLMPDMEVVASEVVKNNDIVLHGISITEPNAEMSVAPLIYIESYLNDVYKSIAKEIVITYKQYKEKAESMTNVAHAMMDFNNIKDKLRIRLVNKKNNAKLFENIVHIDFLDMAIIVVVELLNDGEKTAVVKVTKDLLKTWNCTHNEVFQIASNNTFSIPYSLRSIADTMKEMMGLPEDAEVFDDVPMWVLSNQSGQDGAVEICNYKVMKEIADKLDNDLIVLPSSLHECIIVSKPFGVDMKYISEMVSEINDTQVPPEDVLSDHAYIFSRETGWTY